MSQPQTTEFRKPTAAQVEMLFAAVANNGYLTANLTRGRYARTYVVCVDNGWITQDQRITFTGRNAAHRADAVRYSAALPADHVDYELTRLTHGHTPLAPFGGKFGSRAHVLAIPDTFIQYDVPAEAVGRFIGYHINTRHGLRPIMHVEYLRDGQDWTYGAVIYLSDGKGGIKPAGNVYTEIQLYAPYGGPDLREEAGKVLDIARRAHEELTAAAKPATVVEHRNPNTERADTYLLADDVAAVNETTAAQTGARYQALMVSGDDEPVTVTPYHVTRGQAEALLHRAVTEMARRNVPGKTQMIPCETEVTSWDLDGPIMGSTGGGKSLLTFYPEEADRFQQGGGKSYAALLELMRRSRDNTMHVYDPKAGTPDNSPQIIMAPNHWATQRLTDTPRSGKSLSPEILARMEALRTKMGASFLSPATIARLVPAVDPGPLLPQVVRLRDAIVATVGDLGGIAGDVTAPGYRLIVHTARVSTTSERARDGLMKLETALTEIERGADRIARVILDRALRRFAGK